jgi:DNA polymerase-3 subunit delta
MVAIKANQADRFVAAPDKAVVAVLVYGPDTGLVSERSKAVATALAKRSGDDVELIRIDESDLDQDPDRLQVELQTIPMFGGGKVVRTTAGRKINAAMFKSIFESGAPAVGLVCEAGNLKAADALRKLFEGTGFAAAVPCYGDEARDLGQLVQEMTQEAGLTLSRDDLELLVSRLGADRALSRGEIEKLILYCAGRREITTDDILAIVGDAAEAGLEEIAVAAANGEPKRVVHDLDRAINAGENSQAVLLIAMRYFQRLHRLAALMDQGKSAEEAIRGMRPPVHFKLKDQLQRQLRIWGTAALGDALDRLGAAQVQARLNSTTDDTLVERVLFNLAAHAQRARRR